MSIPGRQSPFDLQNPEAYRRWREGKLAAIPSDLEKYRVDIADLAAPGESEIRQLLGICRQSNWAIFRSATPPTDATKSLKEFARRLGLTRIDHNLRAEDSGVSALTTGEQQTDHDYVPYTNRPLSWHTDGYYNSADRQIRAWILFCVEDAATGGDNSILDHEMLYLRLRDRDPDLVAALMEADALTIPANLLDGEIIRPQRTGPVFSTGPDGRLHMRYSARKRNIAWKNAPKTLAAARAIEALLSGNEAPICHYRLEPCEGIVSNNVLHRREGFSDDPQTGKKRLVLRARYCDRIRGTGINSD